MGDKESWLPMDGDDLQDLSGLSIRSVEKVPVKPPQLFAQRSKEHSRCGWKLKIGNFKRNQATQRLLNQFGLASHWTFKN